MASRLTRLVLSALVLVVRADVALKDAHRALAQASNNQVAEHTRLGELYAERGKDASARFFFEGALRSDPHATDAKARLQSAAEPAGPQAVEAELETLAIRLFASGQLDLGLRADLQRLASLHAREEQIGPIEARDNLNRASLLLLTSGLDAHAIGIARHLLASEAVGCAPCEPPPLLVHAGQPHGISLSAARAFVGCCLQSARLLDRVVTTRKASLHQANDYGFTPLHFAAMGDQAELAVALVRRGADASAKNVFGMTPLHLAATRNATATIAALMDEEAARLAAGVRDAGDSGRTPAQVACELGFTAAARLLDPQSKCKWQKLVPTNVGPWEQVCAFDMRLPADTTATEFIRDYVAIGKPLLVRQGATVLGEWFSADRWSRERLAAEFAHVTVGVADVPGAARSPMTLADFLSDTAADAESRAAVSQPFDVNGESSLARGFGLAPDSFLDPDVTALRPDSVHVSVGPRGAGVPMRTGRARIDILARGSRTWLLQSPSEATHSTLHPADATRTTPWPWAAETLFSCEQEAGDVMFVPDMWAHASINNDDSVSFALSPDAGVSEFSISTQPERPT